jgi:hypothetical protein
MQDPFNITKYDRTDAELEAFLLFAVAVAGKNAVSTDRAFDKLWSRLRFHGLALAGSTPFGAIRNAAALGMFEPELLRQCGFGCYNQRFRSFKAVANSGLDLRKCSAEDLEAIPGIGRKTSRFFILHSRRNARVACLDRHILRFLRERRPNDRIPENTPTNAKEYRRIEEIFLRFVDSDFRGRTPAEYDLAIWRAYTPNKEAA